MKKISLLPLSALGKCNSEIPFVWTFDSGIAGPHVMISALTHGNEPAGLHAIHDLLESAIRPVAGRLTLALVNVDAYGRFFRSADDRWRYVDRDMNRLWRDDWIDADQHSSEAARCRALRPLLQTVDYLLDLHTTAWVARPFYVLADNPQARALADALAWPNAQQIMPGGCAEGRHLTDYGRFSTPGHSDSESAAAVTLECGRHREPQSTVISRQGVLRFLQVTGCIDARQTCLLDSPTPGDAVERFVTFECCIARSDAFVLNIPVTGFVEVIKGQVVATDNGQPVLAPSNAVVISPRPNPGPGEVAFLWSRRL